MFVYGEALTRVEVVGRIARLNAFEAMLRVRSSLSFSRASCSESSKNFLCSYLVLRNFCAPTVGWRAPPSEKRYTQPKSAARIEACVSTALCGPAETRSAVASPTFLRRNRRFWNQLPPQMSPQNTVIPTSSFDWPFSGKQENMWRLILFHSICFLVTISPLNVR